MNLSEYSAYDAIGLAELVAKNQVTPKELAETAAGAIEAGNPKVNAVVETYPDRVEDAARRIAATISPEEDGAESVAALLSELDLLPAGE